MTEGVIVSWYPKPINDLFKIKKIIVSTYQSTSGAGKSAMDELFHQTLDVYKNKNLIPKKFTKKIAFNLIPHIDDFMPDGNTKEENKMILETQKIFNSKIKIFSTCVRVPVFVGHGEAIFVETEKIIDLDNAFKNFDKKNLLCDPVHQTSKGNEIQAEFIIKELTKKSKIINE